MKLDDVEDVIGQIRATPDALRVLLAAVPDGRLDRQPAPGEWSILQVVAHLLHADEFAFVDRIRSIAAGDQRIEKYLPVDEVGLDGPPRAVLTELLDRLVASREAAAELLRSIEPAHLDRAAGHPSGTFSAADFVEEWVFHDADHLQQILEIVKGCQLERVGPAMRRALVQMTDG